LDSKNIFHMTLITIFEIREILNYFIIVVKKKNLTQVILVYFR
jgi:hypothetical protein